eukprot:CAMPEP_0119011108 /NCGR_PEP_ID=MMETSP1176-20130426/5462_1 /TAXON_ID=265551 /ORGANISM="Synedropsis recta cf, Strain CCMP1620" /LENGTH=169 /DNA_ID=CAMNT_0006963883 /DNA_START=13 /DNA_END=522 /DNA_ORIENTATION=-
MIATTTPPFTTTILSVLLLLLIASCQSFTMQPQQQQHRLQKVRSLSTLSKQQLQGSYFDEEDEDDREFARIPRGGRRATTRVMEDDEQYIMDDLEDVVNDYYDDANEFDGLIPNPLLDNIDPEGSSERMGELFSDQKFWFDIGLLLLFLNFLDNLRDPGVFDALDMANM